MTLHLTYFVHATTTDNEQDIATGWQPGALSARGREQARDLGLSLAGREFDTVFSSDLQRAINSAHIAFGDRFVIVTDKRLRECDYGDLNGTSASAFKDRLTDFVETAFPNGESYRDVERRVESFLAGLRLNYEGKRVVLVSHQAPQLALEVMLNGKTWREAVEQDWRRTGAWQPGWEYEVR